MPGRGKGKQHNTIKKVGIDQKPQACDLAFRCSPAPAGWPLSFLQGQQCDGTEKRLSLLLQLCRQQGRFPGSHLRQIWLFNDTTHPTHTGIRTCTVHRDQSLETHSELLLRRKKVKYCRNSCSVEQLILAFIVCSIQVDHNLVNPLLVFHRQILKRKAKQTETELHLQENKGGRAQKA